jgi:MerR family transcriptional regulator, copper efflux regulator
MEHLTSGQVAKQAHVNVETIRYYERRGLIPEPPRRESGYRQYAQEDVTRIQFIKRAQELGFSLREISELLDLRVDATHTCQEVKSHAEAKIADIEQKIETLQRMKDALVKLAAICADSGAPTTECPILEAIEQRRDSS